MKIRIENFRLEPLKDGVFLHPKRARYLQDGEERSWEILESHDSVAVLIWHREWERFVMVRQFRPAVYAHGESGMTVELCAGLVDKEKPLEWIAAEEVEEECGYRVAPESLERITSFFTSVGFAGSRQTLYYVEVEESMHIGPGGGIENEGEQIEVLELDREDARALMEDESVARTPGLLYALCWWFGRALQT
jgi:UDP-sugar diphosphatase